MVRTAAVLSIVKVEVSGEGGKCELIDKMANPLLRFVDAQRTRTDFLSDTASSKIAVSFGAHGPIFSVSLCCENGRRGTIVGLRHSDIYRTEVGAHNPTFYRRHTVGWKGQILSGPKVGAHDTIFRPILSITREKLKPGNHCSETV